jgi:CubicO group peptidase (beta-lactamase class C family)
MVNPDFASWKTYYCLTLLRRKKTNMQVSFQQLKRDFLLAALALFSLAAAYSAPDEAALGKSSNYPKGSMQEVFTERNRVGSFSAMDTIFPSRVVSRGDGGVWMLEKGSDIPAFTYTFEGASYTLEDYLQRRRITSFLVVHKGKILFERYQYDRTSDHKIYSHSISKSITSVLIGQAQEKGFIKSLDDKVNAYAPELKDGPYGDISIRQLLLMGSGLAWDENYGGRDDVSDLWAAYFRVGRGGNPTSVMTRSRRQEAQPGTRFLYSGGDTTALCHVLQGATKRSITDITQEWLWKPLGAQADAAWLYGWHGLENCFGGFNATTRDYPRFGMLLARDGMREGKSIINSQYLLDATDIKRLPKGFGLSEAGQGFGYGYQFWLGDSTRGRNLAMLGTYGQSIHVIPQEDIVVVQTAVWPSPSDPSSRSERSAVVSAMTRALGWK